MIYIIIYFGNCIFSYQIVVNSSQSVITVPSRNRIGILPAVLVIITSALTFILSF